MEYSIRLATDKDKEPLLLLMKEHALYEGHNLDLTIQHQQLSNLALLPVTIFIVESKNNLYGYMSVIKQFSTWDMDWYLYLDCLYLTEETRGQGIGQKLMLHLKTFSKAQMLNMIQWQTPNDNFQAIKFYQKLNTVSREKQRFFWSV